MGSWDICIFFPWLCGYVEELLNKKAMVNFMMSQTGQQIITAHILLNIPSRGLQKYIPKPT